MALYCFYPCAANGLASTFETAELETDAEVESRALSVLDDHRSATSVVVWCGSRKVLTREQPPSRRPVRPASEHGFDRSVEA